MYTLTGMLSLVISPALSWAENGCGNDFNPLNAVQLGSLAISLLVAIVLYFKSQEPFVGGPNAIDEEGTLERVASNSGRMLTSKPEESLGLYIKEFQKLDVDG